MRFRLKAFGLHLLSSACLLSLVLGGLYLGWYEWPGWYVTGALEVAGMLLLVDVLIGPTLTLVVANPGKPRREFARDISIIAVIQLLALIYGAHALWRGRPLYYVFCVDRLQVVQASELTSQEINLSRQQNPRFAPDWTSRPRWIWAPMPQDIKVQQKILDRSLFGDRVDLPQMPRYFKSWQEGEPAIRAKLKKLDEQVVFTAAQRQALKQKLQQLGIPSEQTDTLFIIGKDNPALVVFDPANLKIRAILKAS